MKDNEFEKKDLIKRILEHYIGVTEEKASADIERFLKILSDNNILDNGQVQGSSFIRVPKEMLDKLWSSKNEDKGDGEQ